MARIIKQLNGLQHRFGENEPDGGENDESPEAPPAAGRTVKVDVWIEQVESGYVLQWDGGDPAYSGDMWYEDLDYAEHGAEEMFGIGPDDWD
jgi:hypothetical protein